MNITRSTVQILSLLAIGSTAVGEEKIDFNRDIRPLLSNRCFACHGPDEEERKADLRLDTREGAMMDLGGYKGLVPGNAEDSEIYYRMSLEEDDDDLMPPKGKGAKFTVPELALIKKWIEQDAPYAKHWSYEKPVRPDIPKGKKSDWPVNEIDHFVLARLESEGLQPSPEADRYSLARRVAMDLTGLPPTWDEATAFVNDKAENAYGKYVDAQIAKPAFGERWARIWLDMARYADSAGYADDRARTIWAYRDYVIKSLNDNKPFDQFTIEQLAGDLLENPTQEQLIATAFHRNTKTNSEGGTNDEEFRNAAVVDRVNTTMAAWMGTTIDCAQCHTHKYDPLTHHEYFQLFAFFNQSEDADRANEQPTLGIWTEDQKAGKAEMENRITLLKAGLQSPTPETKAACETWLQSLQKEPEWTQLKPIGAKGNSTQLSIKESGTIEAPQDKLAGNDTYTIELAVPATPFDLTGLKLEVGQEQASNFVLSQVSAKWMPESATTAAGQFVRISLEGAGKMIHVAEVEVFSNGTNVALKGKASQSSTDFGGPAERAIDGNTNGDFDKKSVTHTSISKNPWFEVDLGSEIEIERVNVWNRTGPQLEERLAGYKIEILNGKREVVWEKSPADVPKPNTEFTPGGARNLSFSAATATHEQPGFPASSVLPAKPDLNSGWAIGGGVGTPQELVLGQDSSLKVSGGKIIVTLPQLSVHKSHLLTNFSFSITDSPNVTDWTKMPPEIQTLTKKENPTAAEKEKLQQFYLTVAPELKKDRAELAKLEKQIADMKPATTVPVMKELPAEKHRKTFVHLRGSYASPGDEVTAAVPVAFHPLEENVKPDRMALAKWLMDPENPLTARVVANRHWENIFGTGIVETSEEFGSQGEPPSHPDLLDWLAVDLKESGWDLKRFLKMLVMSATYRQSSKTSPEFEENDPYNRIFARGPRVRVTAEMIRDQALAVSGLLSKKMYGPPVNPPQPNMGLKAAFGSATDWKTSAGEDKYRRGIYTSWRRSNPYPSMATFDAPNREVCTIRRSRTNTPLQALVTLNDPVYIESAQALARKIVAKGGDSPEAKATYAIQNSLIRPPRENEVARLVTFYETAKAEYAANIGDARKIAEQPLGKLPADADVVEYAAWSLVGNIVLNLDEIFMKR